MCVIPVFKEHDILTIDGTDYVLGEAFKSIKFQDSAIYFLIRENGIMMKEECISNLQLNGLYKCGRLKFKGEE